MLFFTYAHDVYLLMSFFFFFNDTATTEIYTLSLHDALPICGLRATVPRSRSGGGTGCDGARAAARIQAGARSEEHTSELQSRLHLVCRLLLEKKKKKIIQPLSKKKKKKINY